MKPRASILALACGLSLAALSSVANAEAASADVSRAESYADEAFEAYQKKNYQDAVVLYLKSLEAAPSADVIFNLAKIYDTKLNDRELAMSFYRRYIADPGAEPERVRLANTRLGELRELEMAAREKPAATPAATPESKRDEDRKALPPPAERRGLTGVQWAGIATGIVGLGGVAVGTVFGLNARSNADTAKEDCVGNDCRTQRGVDAAKDGAREADISTVAFIAGGALTAVGVILLVVGGGSSAPPERDSARLFVSPYAGPGSLGTQVSGRF